MPPTRARSTVFGSIATAISGAAGAPTARGNRSDRNAGRKVYQLKGKSEDLDGAIVFDAEGKPLAFIKLPERCENRCFGGPKNDRI